MVTFHNVYLLLAILIGKSAAQDPLNDVCTWAHPKAATVRGALYVNGGDLTINNNLSSTGLNGSIFALQFSQSFDTESKSFSALFTPLSAQGPTADYWGGAMFATEDKIYLYGYAWLWLALLITSHSPCSGLLPFSARDNAAPSGRVLGYQLYSKGSEQETGPLDEALSTSVSNNITNGAGANVPSESLGFYFSGMEAPGGGQILFDGTQAETASVTAESLIQVDMSSAQQATWSNLTLPTSVTPRANAQLVWVPVSSQGVLIVIGGVIDPTELEYGGVYNASQGAESQLVSPTFMTSLPVYDIASQKWFVQNTSGVVPQGWQLSEFCSVVANEAGSSSFEVYIYGGNDGLNGSSRADVWVLSIPSFTWIHAYDPGSNTTNNSTNARSSHTCVKPYPDQMFVIGGENTNAACFSGIIDVFSLNNLTWLSKYDPTVWANYSIPSIVARSVSATSTAIAMDPSLSTILESKYDKAIPTYYPYSPPPSSTSGSKWLPAVLGAVLGVVGLSIIVFAIWCFRCRRSRKSVTSETQSGGAVHNWMRGVSKPDASVTTTEVDDSGASPLAGYYEVSGDSKYRNARPPQAGVPLVEAEVIQRPATSRRSVHAEADGTERYEMLATHRPATLPRSARAEADGIERYEMHALERDSADAPEEMGRSYHFRDHSLYPRNPTGASETMSPTHEARSTTSGDHSAPSPYVLPQRSVDANDDAISHPASNSPRLSSPDQSPPMASTIGHRPSHKRNVSSMSSGLPISSSPTSGTALDALEAVSGLGYSNSRPMHTRNMSSLSSGIAQLPSPAEQVPADEDKRRSALISNLPSSPEPAPAPAPAPTQDDHTDPESLPLVSHQTLQHIPESRNGRNVVTRKQIPGRSAFREEEMDSTEQRRTL